MVRPQGGSPREKGVFVIQPARQWNPVEPVIQPVSLGGLGPRAQGKTTAATGLPGAPTLLGLCYSASSPGGAERRPTRRGLCSLGRCAHRGGAGFGIHQCSLPPPGRAPHQASPQSPRQCQRVHRRDVSSLWFFWSWMDLVGGLLRCCSEITASLVVGHWWPPRTPRAHVSGVCHFRRGPEPRGQLLKLGCERTPPSGTF